MKYKWTPSYAHLKDNQIKKLDQLLKNKIPITQITKKLNLCSQTIKKYCDDNKINTHQARFKNDWNLKFFNILIRYKLSTTLSMSSLIAIPELKLM